jgi:sortase A
LAQRPESIVRNRSQRIAALALSVVGIACVAEASSIHAKAWLGQQLIADAWRRVQGGEAAPRPWPWADTTPVARLEVPAHGVDLFVLAGGTGRTLAWGPGHLAGTAPVGSPGNAVVGGHRDTHFAFLRDLSVDDEIYTEDRSGKRRLYRVKESFITHDRDAAVLAQDFASRLTLVTCWPFDAPLAGGPQRYVVVAQAQ